MTERYITYPTWREDNVNTTDATVTTVATVSVTAAAAVTIEARVIGHRTGGAGGSADDSAFYTGYALYIDVSGTATLVDSSVPVVLESNAAWDFTFSATGGNALLRVTGDTNNNISWLCQYRVVEV